MRQDLSSGRVTQADKTEAVNFICDLLLDELLYSQVARASSESGGIKERTTAKFQHIHRNTSLIKPSGLIPSSIHFNADKEAGECDAHFVGELGGRDSF